MSGDLKRDGYAIVPDLLTDHEVATLRQEFEALAAGGAARGGAVYGIRGLLNQSPMIRDLANDPRLIAPIADCIGPDPRPVRSIFFDKTQDANWPLPWHQDKSIALANQADVPEFGHWTVKQGVPHAEPPLSLLARMATIRLHLDDTDGDNGALIVAPGMQDRLHSTADLATLRQATTPITCVVPAGGAVLMRPLTPHSSDRSRTDRRRRVLHIEYCTAALPKPLKWAEAA